MPETLRSTVSIWSRFGSVRWKAPPSKSTIAIVPGAA
jgi:hypothetical protein